MVSTAIDASTVTGRDTTRSTPPMRRPHPQDPAVPGPDPARESRARANIQRIACDIVTLNVLTLKALQDGWFQTPQIVNRSRYEEFQGLLTAEERDHIDMIAELSDLGFDAYIAEYVGNLSHADQLRRIMDPKPSWNYSDLLTISSQRYLAAYAHKNLAERVDTLEIPEQYNYCKTYQEYVEYTVIRDVDTRHELGRALKRASSLLNSIKLAVHDGSLSDECLSALKTKMEALQENYSDAHNTRFSHHRDLFDPTSDDWWEYDPSTSKVTEEDSPLSSPPSNAVTAYSGTPKSPLAALNIRATLNFAIPSACLLCCIPIGYAYLYGSSSRGTTTDSDFWQLVAGSVMQALSTATLLMPDNMQSKLTRLSGIYTGLLLITSGITIPASIVFYLFVSAPWSVVVSYIGNAAQVLILLQLANTL